MKQADCLFCKIASRELESNIVHEDEQCVAFRDINPQAPVHFLVIPKTHIASLVEVKPEDESLLGHLIYIARVLAENEGLDKDGYRTVINTGSYAGQTVHHVHVHLMGGRSFRWPPG